jgi:signal transduction histidine kinase/CheY-like chemotaxis protein
MVFELNSRTMVMSLARDITERKKAEEQTRQLQEQLIQSRKLESIGELAGGIAHDFNNQLGAIVGLADLLLNQVEEGSKPYRYAEDILNTAKHSTELTSQLLAFARKGMYRTVPVEINTLIKEVVSILERSIDRRISIRQRLSDSAMMVVGDPGQLQNAVMNLALNARDAMPEGGEMTLSTCCVKLDQDFCRRNIYDISEGDYVKLTVSDTGIGMDEETIKHIFEPFFTTKKPGKGTGMGLAAVYGTIMNHGGAMDLDSEPGEGTTINIYLPSVEDEEEIDKDIERSEREPVTGSGHILLVDDEPAVINATMEILERLGYDVSVCRNGKEAVSFYAESKDIIDAVILDMVMPVMGGREAFAELVKINPDVRVLLSTGYAMKGEAQEIIDKGAAGLIKKPFRMVELASKIDKMLKS